ncbi:MULTISPECIES: hypothetical protein [Chryseobacterium]|uniref:hypothetical protein n=1 Tax=Chryseobacterium TaxID=59732 RepID=UPI0004935C1D|nr:MULTISPECIES: hypothetical protein [Chryseobacterium]MDR6159325.1 hypothetical protein [Chryseobacterium sp. SLBN-27]
MKAINISAIIILIIGLGIFALYIFTNEFERKYKILDCEGVYYSKLFGEPGGLEYQNTQADVGICLCEKYMKNKSSLYKDEILKLYQKHYFKLIIPENQGSKVDTICKYRKGVFMKMYNL